MGWWSEDIIGGDTPLDFVDTFYDIAQIEEFEGDVQNMIPADTFKERLPAMIEFIEKQDYDNEIGFQVLAVKLMEAGAEINEDLKSKIFKACADDEWAQHDETRADRINSLKEAVEMYDGTPIVVKSKGLFEVIGEHLSNGNEGLVNKNIK